MCSCKNAAGTGIKEEFVLDLLLIPMVREPHVYIVMLRKALQVMCLDQGQGSNNP